MVFGFSMVFVVWAASVGWIGTCISVDRVVNVQWYMVSVVKGWFSGLRDLSCFSGLDGCGYFSGQAG